MAALRSLTPEESPFVYGERELSSYLGFPLSISQADVTVTTPDGRMVGRVRTLSGARRLVRGYRKFGGESVSREARSLETQAVPAAATRPVSSPPETLTEGSAR